MNRIVRFCSLLTASLLLSGCFSLQLDPKHKLDWGLEIKYAGSYEIKDYYDLAEEETWPNCLYIDCYIENKRDETINFIDINDISFKANVKGVEFDAIVDPDDPTVLATASFGCSQKLNIKPGMTYNFQLTFYNYESKYFTDDPVFDENTASFVTDMVINPAVALNGLIFDLYQAKIDEEGYLIADFMVTNYTGVVVKDIRMNCIKGFQHIGNGELESDYKRVLFVNEFESDWKDANLAKDAQTLFTIPLMPINDTFDADYFSQEMVSDFILAVDYSFSH